MARPKSDLAPRILASARARFLAEGVDGASLRQIASDAGTNIGMVYYYYPTKDDLFLAVLEEVYGVLLADVQTALRSDVPPEQRIERVYQRVAAMSDVEFQVVRITIREALVSSDRLARVADRMMRGHLPWLLATLAEGRGSERFDPTLPMPVELAVTMVLGIFPQIVLRLVRAADLPIAPMLPEAAEAPPLLAKVLLYGIAGPALRDPPAPEE